MKKYIDEEGHEVRVWYDGTKHWWKNGKRHRDGDKPAIVHADGTKYWFKNGGIHRENNPAYQSELNEEGYYLENYPYDSKEYWIRLLLLEY